MTGVIRFLKFLLKVSLVMFVGVSSTFFSFFIVLVVLIAVGAGMAAGSSAEGLEKGLSLEHAYGQEDSSHTLAAVSVNGVILGSRDETTGLFELLSDMGVVYGYEVKDQLKELAKDDDVKGVIIEINSPGGTIYGTQAITDGIEEYKKETGKPVIAFVSSVAASGGYWVAAASDEILADRGTALGSIGVLSGPYKYYDGVVSESIGFGGSVQTSGGIQTEYITAGQFKDFGNPYREMSDEERARLQMSVDSSYQDFVNFVSQHRGISETVIKEQIGAMIYNDKQAQELKLSDRVTSRDDAYLHLAQLTGAEGDNFKVVKEKTEQTFFQGVFSSFSLKSFVKFVQAVKQQGTPQPQACVLDNVVLAYHGDVAALCR